MSEPRPCLSPVPVGLEDELNEHRAATVRRILTAVDRLSPGWSERRHLGVDPELEHAVLHHTLYETREAARHGDHARARAALALWEQEEISWAPVVPTAVGPVLMAEAPSCRRSEDDRFLSPLYTLTAGPAPSARPVPRDLLLRGAGHIVDAGLGHLPAAALGIVVLLSWRPPTGTTHSYSVTALPGTTFADWTDDAVRWGEILLHESSHSWLNECLDALGIRLPPQPTWFSAWKRAPRPTYGILHAAFAFSLMVRYFAYVAGASAPGTTAHRYCSTRLVEERLVLARMAADVRQAAALVPDRRLRTVILDQVERALDSSGPGTGAPSRRQER
ncbi:MAG: aKG-HExxH-type peptide beta-hydroxylase, partial [Acidimicrobiia bacterium]